MISPYKTLMVPPDSSDETIKKAYKKLSMKHHPDKGGDKDKFQEITKAYEQIKTPEARGQCTRSQSNPFGGVHINTNNFSDLFKPTIKGFLSVTLQDLAEDKKHIVQLSTHIVEIDIPPTINDGDTIKYPQPNNTDLLITFRIVPDMNWERTGNDLTMNLDIDFWDLILGGSATVSNILNQQLNIIIPVKSEPGTKLRLKGHGLHTGDMYVRLNAVMPSEIPDAIINEIKRIKTK